MATERTPINNQVNTRHDMSRQVNYTQRASRHVKSRYDNPHTNAYRANACGSKPSHVMSDQYNQIATIQPNQLVENNLNKSYLLLNLTWHTWHVHTTSSFFFSFRKCYVQSGQRFHLNFLIAQTCDVVSGSSSLMNLSLWIQHNMRACVRMWQQVPHPSMS